MFWPQPAKTAHTLPTQLFTSQAGGEEMSSVFDRLSVLLGRNDAQFNVIRHEPVFTSEEAAQVRGTSLSSGAKALICKLDGGFVMFVLPADRRLDSKAVRKQLEARSMRFASHDEILDMTGLKPGSIPPFGSLFGLKTYCDERLRDESVINFNAGDHAISISMAIAEYERVERPEMGTFAQV
jgi:Ala-tRNA(Pro) deacylase